METEKKYLARIPARILDGARSKELTQGYISTDPVIRIRRAADEFYLTVKGGGAVTREEFEMRINEEQYASLFEKIATNVVEKTRYYIPLNGGLTAELDVYGGNLGGLVTVEVEFDTEEAAEAFDPPEWFGEDISLVAGYKNNNLAVYGIP